MSNELTPVPQPSLEVRLPPLPTGWQVVQYGALRDGTLAVLSTDVDLASERERIRAANLAMSDYRRTRLDALAAVGTARIWVIGPAGWTESLTCPLEADAPLFDRFSDGQWVIVNVSSQDAGNVRVFALNSEALARFQIGGCVSHIGIDARDRVWVGWADQGIFGNSDWRVPGQDGPPSMNGVACFAPDGALLPLRNGQLKPGPSRIVTP